MRRILLLVLACGCGGGGGGTPPPSQDPAPTGDPEPATVTGELEVFLPQEETVLESEPNDQQLQAHFLGELAPARRLRVLGHLDAATDGTDSFRLLAPERVKITVSFQYESPDAAGLVLGVWDFVAQSFLETFPASSSPLETELVLKGGAALVLALSGGRADYVLSLDVDAPPSEIEEREPNDGFHEGRFLGEVLVDDRLTATGEVAFFLDRRDSVTVVCPEALSLELTLGIPPTGLPEDAELDLHVHDVTAGGSDPPLLATLPWGEGGFGFTRGTVEIAAGSVIQAFVESTVGDARWELTFRGRAPLAPSVADALAPESEIARAPQLLRFTAPGAEIVPGEILVTPAGGGAPRLERARVAMPPGLTREESERFTLRAVARIARDPGTRHAAPNFVRRAFAEPDDTYFPLQWHYAQIKLPAAWDLTTGDEDVVVAVIDTGSTPHPDTGNLFPGFDFISSASNAGDGDGIDPDPTDVGDEAGPGGASTFHGSHVAGTIGAATDNGMGVSGAGWRTSVMHLRVLGKSGGTDLDVAHAIRYAARLPNASGTLPSRRADIINMSLGGPGFSQVLQDAVNDARAQGVVVFAAAGNSNTATPSYPAALAGVISVGAVDLAGRRAPYSNFGSTIDVVAPGGNLARDDNLDGWPDGVLSTIFDDSVAPAVPVYAFFQGTSMACPHAAAVAALMLATDPDLTPDEIEAILEATTIDLGAAGRDDTFGHGLVDAQAAVLASRVITEPDEPPLLGLSALSLTFEQNETEKTVQVANLGEGLLELDPPTAIVQSAVPWLSVEVLPGDGITTNTSALRVLVDRTDLGDGVYFGRVLVQSSGGDKEIQVLMRVESAPQGPPDLDVYVRVVDVETGVAARTVLVNPLQTLQFTLDNVPPGLYRLEAGTDDNGNGVLCEEGELCGAYPLASDPILIDLRPGETRGPFHFTVGPSGVLPTDG